MISTPSSGYAAGDRAVPSGTSWGGDVSGSTGHTTDGLSLSVHGPSGVLDLVVPAEASAGDVAIEYAAQARMAAVPTLLTGVGRALDPEQSLEVAGVRTGSVLVALLHGSAPPVTSPSRRRRPEERKTVTGSPPGRSSSRAPGALSVLWFCICLLYTSPSPRDGLLSRMPSSA